MSDHDEPPLPLPPVSVATGPPPSVDSAGFALPTPMSPTVDATFEVPLGIRVAAAWCWRMLLIGVTIYVLARIFDKFQELFVPVLVALLLTALVKPIHRVLARRPGKHGLPNSLAAILTVLFTIVVIFGLMALIGQQVATGFGDLRDDAATGLTDLQGRLANSPLHLTNTQVSSYVSDISNKIRGNSGGLVSSALSVTDTVTKLVTGFFIALFSGYFFLSGGAQIWAWIVGLFPKRVRPKVHGAGNRAWATLTAFIRATVIVALVDGFGVGIGAAILGVPLAVPLGVLVFIGAFVPVIGALVAGVAAALVALVAGGVVKALIMLGVVILVQQVEAHVLQPFLLGRAVRVHPLAVILSIGAGVLLAGIVGALFAVPFAAVTNVVFSYLTGHEPDDEGPRPEEGRVGPLADEKQDDTPDSSQDVDPTEPGDLDADDDDRRSIAARVLGRSASR